LGYGSQWKKKGSGNPKIKKKKKTINKGEPQQRASKLKAKPVNRETDW
jgi:hypothetical protein